MLPEPFFAGRGLDRADALRSQPGAVAELGRHPAARQLLWRDGAPACGADGRLEWQGVESGEPLLFLGLDGNAPRFSGLLTGPPAEMRAHVATLAMLDPRDGPLFATALSLNNWHGRHPFCSVCGGSTELVRGGWSRRCEACAAEHFPRADPVVIMLAEHDGRLLLGRQPRYPPGRYSALAGFVEPGETIEAAVARELHEEAGIQVADVRYVASQPWPFPSSLMIGCHARSLDGKLVIDGNELEDARWFDRAAVAFSLKGDGPFDPPGPYAIARTLLERWLCA